MAKICDTDEKFKDDENFKILVIDAENSPKEILKNHFKSCFEFIDN